MELKDAIELMTSKDYKERFLAEYKQLSIRYNSLENMIDKWDKGTLEFIPTCPRSIYNLQLKAMKDYLFTLEARALKEGIEL